jgi:hypothetical protein
MYLMIIIKITRRESYKATAEASKNGTAAETGERAETKKVQQQENSQSGKGSRTRGHRKGLDLHA